MNVTLIQHAQHDIHGHDGRQNQPDLVIRGGQKCLGRPLELRAQGRGQGQLFLHGQHRVHSRAQRGTAGHVERNGGRRELALTRDGKLYRAFLQRGDAGQRHGLARGAAHMDILNGRRAQAEARGHLQHHLVLVGLGENGGNKALAQGVVQGVVYIRHADAQPSGRVAVDVQPGHAPRLLKVAGHMLQFGPLGQGPHHARRPELQLFAAQGFHAELILGARNAVLNGQILHGLHVQGQPRQMRGPRHEPLGNGRGAGVTLGKRLELHSEARSAHTLVDAVHAHEKDHAFHGRILKNHFRQLALASGHSREGRILRGLGDALNHARVLHGKKTFGRHDIQKHSERQCAQGHAQGQALVGKNPIQPALVPEQQTAEKTARLFSGMALRPQHDRAEHGRERERNHR